MKAHRGNRRACRAGVEDPLGSIRQWTGRRPENARDELGLSVLACKLRHAVDLGECLPQGYCTAAGVSASSDCRRRAGNPFVRTDSAHHAAKPGLWREKCVQKGVGEEESPPRICYTPSGLPDKHVPHWWCGAKRPGPTVIAARALLRSGAWHRGRYAGRRSGPRVCGMASGSRSRRAGHGAATISFQPVKPIIVDRFGPSRAITTLDSSLAERCNFRGRPGWITSASTPRRRKTTPNARIPDSRTLPAAKLPHVVWSSRA